MGANRIRRRLAVERRLGQVRWRRPARPRRRRCAGARCASGPPRRRVGRSAGAGTRRVRAAQPGTGSQSSSVKQTTGARAAATPALRAAAGPRPAPRTSRARGAPATAAATAAASREASSTTTISSSGTVWRSSAARQAARRSGRSRVGTTTETRGTPAGPLTGTPPSPPPRQRPPATPRAAASRRQPGTASTRLRPRRPCRRAWRPPRRPLPRRARPVPPRPRRRRSPPPRPPGSPRAQPQRRSLQRAARSSGARTTAASAERERRGRIDVGAPEDDGHRQVDGEHGEQRGRQHGGEQGAGEPT